MAIILEQCHILNNYNNLFKALVCKGTEELDQIKSTNNELIINDILNMIIHQNDSDPHQIIYEI